MLSANHQHNSLYSNNLEDDLKNKRKSLFEQSATIQDLTRQVEILRPFQKEVSKLKYQLQDNEEEISRLRKVETVAERYRQKLESQQDMKLKLEFLQEKNDNLNRLLEGDDEENNSSTSVSALKKLESERNKLLQIQEQLNYKLNKQEEELVELKKSCKDSEKQLEELRAITSKYQTTDSYIYDDTDNDSVYDKDYNFTKESMQEIISKLTLEVEKWKKIADEATGHIRPESVRTAADIRTLIDHYEVLMKNQEQDVLAHTVRKPSGIRSVSSATMATAVTTSTRSHFSKTDWKEEAEKLQLQVQNLRIELVLMSSAWHSLASRVQQQSVVVMKRSVESPRGWLNRQRSALARMSETDDSLLESDNLASSRILLKQNEV